MHRFHAALLAAVVSLAGAMPAAAEEPPHPTFDPAPPGTVVQSQVVYLAGQAMHSQWRGVMSKKAVGTGNGETFYQWFLSIYQIDGTTYHLRYQSPAKGGPFDALAKANGANLWFPRQDGSIVGAASFTGQGIEQLVVLSHQTGADCGSAQITIFGYDTKTNKVVPSVSVQNACALNAKIVQNGDGTASLQLSGPYYNATAALCCPTKPKATATLKFVNGKWVETPNYYKFYPNAFPQ